MRWYISRGFPDIMILNTCIIFSVIPTWTHFKLKAHGLTRALCMVIGHHTQFRFYILTSDYSCLSICILLFFFLERNRRSGRQHPMSTRRMVALYDYDPRESSPNVDVEVPSPAAPAFRYVSIIVCHRGVKAEKAPNILSHAGNERLYSTINASIFSKV